jgi:SAM-dependent methyltransferase
MATTFEPQDTWAVGDAYEAYVGRWSEPVAVEFLDWLDAGTSRRWLDVGCGTGMLTRCIVERCEPRRVIAVDPSTGFLAHAARVVRDPRVSFLHGRAELLPVEAGAADAAVAGLVLNFVPAPERALADMARAVGVDGRVGAYVWDYADGMQMIRRFWDAAAALDSGAAELDEARRFPSCTADGMAAAFRRAGLRDIEVTAIDVPTPFDSFDDFWEPFLGGQGPAPTYCASLPEGHRDALRERLRERLPIDARGRIALTARAWAAKGRPLAA